MLVPVIFMVAMVVRAAHSFEAELVNGTVTFTIMDFENACKNARLMRHDVPKEMDEKYTMNRHEGDPTKDIETLFRSMLEEMCPFVGYFPITERTEEEESRPKEDTFESDYPVDDSVTETTLTTVYSYISNTTEKNRDVLMNSTSTLTSTTENIIIITNNESYEVTADSETDSFDNVTDSIFPTKITTKYPSFADKKSESILYNATTDTTLDILVNSTTEKSKKSILEMTDSTLDDSSIKETTYDSSTDATPTISVKINSTLLKHKDDSTIDEIVSSTSNSVSTSSAKYEIKESSVKENVTCATPIGKITNESDIIGDKLNTTNSKIDSTSTVPSTKNTTKEDVITPTLSSTKTTDVDIANNSKSNDLTVHTTGVDTSDYSSVVDTTTESSTKNMGYTSDETSDPINVKTGDVEDSTTDDNLDEVNEGTTETSTTVKQETESDSHENKTEKIVTYTTDDNLDDVNEGTTETSTTVKQGTESDTHENKTDKIVTYTKEDNSDEVNEGTTETQVEEETESDADKIKNEKEVTNSKEDYPAEVNEGTPETSTKVEQETETDADGIKIEKEWTYSKEDYPAEVNEETPETSTKVEQEPETDADGIKIEKEWTYSKEDYPAEVNEGTPETSTKVEQETETDADGIKIEKEWTYSKKDSPADVKEGTPETSTKVEQETETDADGIKIEKEWTYSKEDYPVKVNEGTPETSVIVEIGTESAAYEIEFEHEWTYNFENDPAEVIKETYENQQETESEAYENKTEKIVTSANEYYPDDVNEGTTETSTKVEQEYDAYENEDDYEWVDYSEANETFEIIIEVEQETESNADEFKAEKEVTYTNEDYPDKVNGGTTETSSKVEQGTEYDAYEFKNEDEDAVEDSHDSKKSSEIEGSPEIRTEAKQPTELDAPNNKSDTKVTYQNDTKAVDERRKIVVILFASILLILSLIWAVKVLYNKHKGSYDLPQEGDDMELGDNSTDSNK